MSENNSDLGAFLAGFVIGGLVGAATALILAPQSGDETKNLLVRKGQELRHASQEQMEHYRELADNYTQEYRDRANQALAETRNRAQETRGRVQEQARIVLDTGRERVTQVKEQVDALVQSDNEQAGDSNIEDTATAS